MNHIQPKWGKKWERSPKPLKTLQKYQWGQFSEFSHGNTYLESIPLTNGPYFGWSGLKAHHQWFCYWYSAQNNILWQTVLLSITCLCQSHQKTCLEGSWRQMCSWNWQWNPVICGDQHCSQWKLEGNTTLPSLMTKLDSCPFICWKARMKLLMPTRTVKHGARLNSESKLNLCIQIMMENIWVWHFNLTWDPKELGHPMSAPADLPDLDPQVFVILKVWPGSDLDLDLCGSGLVDPGLTDPNTWRSREKLAIITSNKYK